MNFLQQPRMIGSSMLLVGSLCAATAHGDTIHAPTYLKASNTGPADAFGAAVSVSGSTLVVGAFREDSNATGVDGDGLDNSAMDSGAAYVFVRSGSTWVQQAYLKASNRGAGDFFGHAVAISGDTIAVSAPREASSATGIDGVQTDDSAPSSGAVYVFVRTGSTWNQQAYIKASNTDASDYFGQSLSLEGDTLVVGAGGESSAFPGVNGNQADNSAAGAGAVYVFVRNGSTWTQQSYIKASNPDALDLFGASVSLSSDSLVVGAYHESSSATVVNGNQLNNSSLRAGAAYVFVRSGTSWTQQAYLKASNTDVDDQFGYSVSIDRNTLVVGAVDEGSSATGINGNQADNAAFEAGAAYVFVRSGSTWSQQAYLKASNTDPFDYFGVAVAVSYDKILVGAPGESSNAVGLNGNQANNAASAAGCAYLFSRSGTTWTQDAYIKASNTGSGDYFGYALAFSNGIMAIGAHRESSDATGVDGNQASNGASTSGAVYAFSVDSTSIPYCFGDGTMTPCPCGNAGTSGHGCSNYAFAAGGLLVTSGFASCSTDTLALTASNLFPTTPGLFLQGTVSISSGTAFGNGLLCVTGPTARLQVRFADSVGTASTTIPIHTVGMTNVGDLRHYQFYYRDDASFCTGAGFNTTNALSLTWLP